MAAISAGPAAVNRYSANADRYDKERVEIQNEARKFEEESHTSGAKALRTHIGEVFLELAIVLASLAILTKRKPVWYMSMLSGLVGAGIAVTALLIH